LTAAARAHELVHVTARELVARLGEGLEVSDWVVRGAGGEEVTEGERRERRPAATAAAANDDAFRVRVTAGDEVTRRVDAVVDVEHTPPPIERSPVVASVANRPAVI